MPKDGSSRRSKRVSFWTNRHLLLWLATSAGLLVCVNSVRMTPLLRWLKTTSGSVIRKASGRSIPSGMLCGWPITPESFTAVPPSLRSLIVSASNSSQGKVLFSTRQRLSPGLTLMCSTVCPPVEALLAPTRTIPKPRERCSRMYREMWVASSTTGCIVTDSTPVARSSERTFIATLVRCTSTR